MSSDAVGAEPVQHPVELTLDSAVLQSGDHVGVFYRGAAERDAFSIPLIGAAIEAQCGVIYVCDRSSPDDLSASLVLAGIEVAQSIARGQLRVVASSQVYTTDGRFDPNATVAYFQGIANANARAGYPLTCAIGEMCWSLRGHPGSDRLLEYEALYHAEFEGAAVITLCMYDLDLTRGDHLFDLLRLHPRAVLNGIEMRNPYPDRSLLHDLPVSGELPCQ